MVDRVRRIVLLNTKARELEVENFVLRLEGFLGKNLGKVIDRLRDVDVNAVEYAKAVASLEEAMGRAGLGKQMDRLRDIYGAELARVDELFRVSTGRKPPPLTQFDAENIAALVDQRLYASMKSVQKYLGDAQQIIVNSAFGGGIRRVDLDEQLGTRAIAAIQAEQNTGLMGYNRLVNDIKAEEAGLDLFLYVGPDDAKTREFCQDRVNRVWTREQIDSWDEVLAAEGQPTPAFIHCGGYNCRHHLQPVSKELVEEMGLLMGDEDDLSEGDGEERD